MKVLVVVDGHLGRTPDGRVWSERIYNYDFFARYLSAFEDVRVAMRIKDIQNNEGYPNLCSGEHVEFYPIEEFKGPKEYIKKYFQIKKKQSTYFEGCDCGIFRIPSTVGYQLMHGFEKTKKPYAIEVVVDPWDFFAPGTSKSPVRPIIRKVWTDDLKRACKKANGVSYVTRDALQKRYPSMARINGESKLYFESYYSSVNIPSNYFGKPREYQKKDVYSIVHVTNFIGNHVKGHEELIAAVGKLKQKGIIVNVNFVGEGTLIEEFKNYAREKGVGEQIHFIGKLPTPALVREELLRNDLFVFPSHAEGLPRVLIEAMAVGLPCISTNVNGIPELLDSEYLVEVGDIDGIAEKIEKLVTSTAKMSEASKRNLKTAYEYEESVLQERRKRFYLALRVSKLN